MSELQNLAVKEKQTSCKVNIFGGISCSTGGNFFFVSTKFNGDECKDLVEKKFLNILLENNLVYQTDNASIHNSCKTFLGSKGIVVLPFPPKIPDLNPIENVWAQLQRLVDEELKTVTIKHEIDLKKIVTDSLKKIDLSFIQKIITSMKSRIEQVIKNNGLQTKYWKN